MRILGSKIKSKELNKLIELFLKFQFASLCGSNRALALWVGPLTKLNLKPLAYNNM